MTAQTTASGRVKSYRAKKKAAGLCYEGGCPLPAGKAGGRCEPHAKVVRDRTAIRKAAQAVGVAAIVADDAAGPSVEPGAPDALADVLAFLDSLA